MRQPWGRTESFAHHGANGGRRNIRPFDARGLDRPLHLTHRSLKALWASRLCQLTREHDAEVAAQCDVLDIVEDEVIAEAQADVAGQPRCPGPRIGAPTGDEDRTR